MSKISVLIITYRKRFNFLSKVVNAVINNPHLFELVIVNNASDDSKEINNLKNNSSKIKIINFEKNIGSAGGYSAGLEYIRDTQCDYVFLLDDDNVPESGFVEKFLDDIKTIGLDKIVVLGNRHNLKNSQDYFYKDEKISEKIPSTLFEVFSLKKIKHFINLLFGINKQNNSKKIFKPIVEVEAFAFGGAFLPIQAIKDSPLPDSKLFLYCDDVDYSWGVRKVGYRFFLCNSPKIDDIDLTFQESHLLEMFSPTTSDFKIFFRTRNMSLISRKHTKNIFSLYLNVFIWYLGLCFYTFLKMGISKFILKRMILILKSLYRGIKLNYDIPSYIEVPGNK